MRQPTRKAKEFEEWENHLEGQEGSFFTENIQEVRNQLLAQGRVPKVYPSSPTKIRTLCFDKVRLHQAPPQWPAIKECCRIAKISWYPWMGYGALAVAVALQVVRPKRQKEEKAEACENCGSTENLEAHHTTPFALGGKVCETLCQICHAEATRQQADQGLNLG